MIQATQFNKKVRVHKYGYRPSKLHERGFHVVKKVEGMTTYQPVGDFVSLRTKEDDALSEKKVINIVNLLNDEELIPLGNETKAKCFYEISGADSDEEDQSGSSGSGSGAYVMRLLPAEGVSIPDAMISFSDDEAQGKFRTGIKRYCKALSAINSRRNPALYGARSHASGLSPEA